MALSFFERDILILSLSIMGIIPLAIAGLQTPSVIRALELGIGDIMYGSIIFITGVDLGVHLKK